MMNDVLLVHGGKNIEFKPVVQAKCVAPIPNSADRMRLLEKDNMASKIPHIYICAVMPVMVY